MKRASGLRTMLFNRMPSGISNFDPICMPEIAFTISPIQGWLAASLFRCNTKFPDRAAKPAGRVLACEPNPLLAETYLPQNMALNGFYHGVEICPKVVTDVDDREVDFILHKGDFATSSLEQWAYQHKAESISVSSTTIDRLCTDWPRFDLIKIDAEGAESLVWQGMAETRKRFPYVGIVLELHSPRDPQSAELLLSRIIEEQYSISVVEFQGKLVTVAKSDVLSQPHEHWTVWIAP
jgi:FkbM family methyltransferase